MCGGRVPTLRNRWYIAPIALLAWFDKYGWFSARMFWFSLLTDLMMFPRNLYLAICAMFSLLNVTLIVSVLPKVITNDHIGRPNTQSGTEGTRLPWWRHQMETFFALLAICVENLPVTDEFPAQRPVTLSCDVFFDLSLIKRLSKHSWGWWFETPSRQFWRHFNEWNVDHDIIIFSPETH